MPTQREQFERWLETLSPHLSPTSVVKGAWLGWQAAFAETQPTAWIVIDNAGVPHFTAGWPEACHEHINEMLSNKFEEAKHWHVAPVFRIDGAAPSEIETLRTLAFDAYMAWDSTADSRVGKLLRAMLDKGFRDSYRPDLRPNAQVQRRR